MDDLANQDESSQKNTFLFVNESSSTASKKVGRRTDIKSHVRNHIVQREKTKRKRGDKDAIAAARSKEGNASSSNRSTTIEPSQRSFHEHESAQQSFSHPAPEGGSGGNPPSPFYHEWNPSSPSPTSPQPLNQISGDQFPSTSAPLQLPSPPESEWYAHHKPITPSITPLPKPSVVSDALEKALALAIRNPISPSFSHPILNPPSPKSTPQLRPSYAFQNRQGTPTSSIYDIVNHDHSENCQACGAPESAWMVTRDIERQRQWEAAAQDAIRRQTFRSRPLDALGKLGNGRVDPFNCYPSMVPDPNGNLHELVDHAVTYLLPGLIADASTSTPSTISSAWMSSSLSSPLLFHALVFAGSIHLSYMQSSTISPKSPVALTHKLAVINQLNSVLASPTERIKDEIILAILILSSHEVMDLTVGEERCFDSPLRNMQWLNVYGNIRNEQSHLKAVMDLITLRGGVENLEMYGLAEILLGGDVVSATTSLHPPTFRPLIRSQAWLKSLHGWATSPPRLPYLTLSKGFAPLLTTNTHNIQSINNSYLLSLLTSIACVTLAIEHHLSGEPNGVSLTMIARTRTTCQQRLLALPSATTVMEVSTSTGDDRERYIYETIRLTTLIYSTGVIFPIPRSRLVLQTLIRQLATSFMLLKENLHQYPPSRHSSPQLTSSPPTTEQSLRDVLLWTLIIGGIAAREKEEEEWYISELLVLFDERRSTYTGGIIKIGWGNDWSDIEQVLGRFLWLDSACGRSGKRLWGLVLQRLQSRDRVGVVAGSRF